MDFPVDVAEAVDALEGRLVDLLLRGDVDARSVDRATWVALDDDQRVDKVIIQLGLGSERGLAEAYSELAQTPIEKPAAYKFDTPLSARRPGSGAWSPCSCLSSRSLWVRRWRGSCRPC